MLLTSMCLDATAVKAKHRVLGPARQCSLHSTRGTLGARHVHPRHCRKPVVPLASGAGSSGPDDLKQQARLLNNLFYGSPAKEKGVAPRSSGGLCLHMQDVPLWRVQWTVLPGMQEVLHVHAPHYLHMFEGLFRRPRPWYFGHLYLPNGSESLGDPSMSLSHPGSRAPRVGVLMEVSRALRLPQGRLLIVATAVARIKVARALQDTPYSAADVEVGLDYEEMSSVATSCSEMALTHLEEEVDIQLAMRACEMVGRVSAVAYSNCWLNEYELAMARESEWDEAEPREPANTAEMGVLVKDLLNYTREVVPLPDGPVVGRWDVRAVEERAAQQSQQAAEQFDMAAFLAAAPPARLALGSDMYGPAAAATSAMEQQAPWMEDGNGDLLRTVAKLEQAVWRELDAVAALAFKVHGKRLMLPLGLLQLRPPPPDTPPARTPPAQPRPPAPPGGPGSAPGPAATAGPDTAGGALTAPSAALTAPSAALTAQPSSGVAGSSSGSGGVTEPAAASSAASGVADIGSEAGITGTSAVGQAGGSSAPGQPSNPTAAAAAAPATAAGSSTGRSEGEVHGFLDSESDSDSEEDEGEGGEGAAGPLVDAGGAAGRSQAGGGGRSDRGPGGGPAPPPGPASSTGDAGLWALPSDATELEAATYGTPTTGDTAALLAAADSEVQSGKYDRMASEGLDLCADPGYPLHRRAQRLSYAAAAAVLKDVGPERWQELLEAPCTAQRLKIVHSWLRRQRNLYAALSAMKGLRRSTD